MEFEVKESKMLDEGVNFGIIAKIEYRTEPYEYTDLYIEVEGRHQIKWGCPSVVSEKSKLGKLLSQFTNLKVGEKVDPEKVLIGKQVRFQIIYESGKDGGNYCKVVDGSIKPVKTENVMLKDCDPKV